MLASTLQTIWNALQVYLVLFLWTHWTSQRPWLSSWELCWVLSDGQPTCIEYASSDKTRSRLQKLKAVLQINCQMAQQYALRHSKMTNTMKQDTGPTAYLAEQSSVRLNHEYLLLPHNVLCCSVSLSQVAATSLPFIYANNDANLGFMADASLDDSAVTAVAKHQMEARVLLSAQLADVMFINVVKPCFNPTCMYGHLHAQFAVVTN